MDRKHLILPAALLAASAFLGGRAVLGTMSLGDGEQASSRTAVTTSIDDTLAARSAELDAAAARIDDLADDTPPATTTPVAATPVTTPVTTTPTSSAPATHGGRGRDHAEDDGTVEHAGSTEVHHGGGGDDDGPDHDANDDHGGSRGGDDSGSDDRGGDDSGHGGSGHGGGDDD